MFMAMATELAPVSDPTMIISTWFTLFVFSLDTSRLARYDKIPPSIKVTQMKKPATDN